MLGGWVGNKRKRMLAKSVYYCLQAFVKSLNAKSTKVLITIVGRFFIDLKKAIA